MSAFGFAGCDAKPLWLSSLTRANGFAWCLRKISDHDKAVGWECPRGSELLVFAGEENVSLRFARWPEFPNNAAQAPGAMYGQCRLSRTSMQGHRRTNLTSVSYLSVLIRCLSRKDKFLGSRRPETGPRMGAGFEKTRQLQGEADEQLSQTHTRGYA